MIQLCLLIHFNFVHVWHFWKQELACIPDFDVINLPFIWCLFLFFITLNPDTQLLTVDISIGFLQFLYLFSTVTRKICFFEEEYSWRYCCWIRRGLPYQLVNDQLLLPYIMMCHDYWLQWKVCQFKSYACALILLDGVYIWVHIPA